jgi:hypothetical protein
MYGMRLMPHVDSYQSAYCSGADLQLVGSCSAQKPSLSIATRRWSSVLAGSRVWIHADDFGVLVPIRTRNVAPVAARRKRLLLCSVNLPTLR